MNALRQKKAYKDRSAVGRIALLALLVWDTVYPMKAIAYLRVSTDDQANGLEVQRAEIGRWARARGIEVSAWFEDRGVSGGASLDKRPALMGALGELRRGDVLVVQKRDRLARDVGNAILVERIVAKAKASLVSAHGEGEGDAEDPMAFAFRRMADVFSEVEKLQIRARTKAALRAKKARGEVVGQVPYGYRREGAMLVEDAGEAEVVSAVRALRAEGVSLRAIVSKLEELGHKSRAGKPLALTQVANIVKREESVHA